jgi:DNA mismatch repair ATPase MutS
MTTKPERLLKELVAFLQTFLPWVTRRVRLRALWGKPGDGSAFRASWYFELLRKNLSRAAVVDDKSWSDLEFPRFFTALDTTITAIGRQYLFAQLRTYEYQKEVLDQRYHSYAVLAANRELRERIQLTLKPLEIDSAAHIADLLLGPEPERVPHIGLVRLCMLLAIAAVMGAIAHLAPLWVCAIPILVNMGVAGKVDAKLGRNVDALLNCGRMLGVANRLARIRSEDTFSELRQLRAEAGLRKDLKTQIKWLWEGERLRTTDLVGGVIVILNFFFLLKLTLYARSIDRFAADRASWLSTFQLIGAIDASIAVASFLSACPEHCRPTVVSEPEIAIENGYHPLLSKPVKNSIRLANLSALVTGSNMTGKTTFIKMVAINVILGHTLGICLADEAVLPRSPVRALIRGEQSVEEGKSRYFAEAEAIRDFIAESASGDCRIFILDEPFSGTNTVERIAIAKAVLRAIGRHAQLLVTTHDVELQHLLGEKFELFYFQEDPSVEGFFDHKLHTGAGTQRNAIRVLERLGYPAEILTEALATVPTVDAARS